MFYTRILLCQELLAQSTVCETLCLLFLFKMNRQYPQILQCFVDKMIWLMDFLRFLFLSIHSSFFPFICNFGWYLNQTVYAVKVDCNFSIFLPGQHKRLVPSANFSLCWLNCFDIRLSSVPFPFTFQKPPLIFCTSRILLISLSLI